MYPKNNASPERIAVGQVVLIADGTIQSSGVSITVRGQGGSEAAGGGTTAYGADNTVYYTPTQAETNYTSFVVIASKASCFSVSQTIITTSSSTAGVAQLAVTPPTAAQVVDEWETQSQADPTGFHVNLMEANSDATAPGNLALMYNGTGYTDDTAPASRSQISGIGSGSAGAVNIKASEDNSSAGIDPGTVPVTKVGTITGDFNNLHAVTDGATIVSIAGVGNDIGYVAGYYVGTAKAAASASITANLNGNTDSMLIKAYNHIVGDLWDTVGVLSGTGGASYVSFDVPLYQEHTGTGAELGKVYLQFDNNGTTPNLLEIDRCSVSAVSNVEGITNGSTVTLNASTTNTNLIGNNWNLVLNSQAITGSYINGGSVSGIGTGSGSTFDYCQIGTVTTDPATFNNCDFNGTYTAGANGDYYIHDPKSGVAGSGSPVYDFTTNITGATNANIRGHFGGGTWQLNSFVTASIEVVKGGGHSIAVGGADVEFRGDCRAITLTTVASTSTVQIHADTGPISINGTGGTVNIYGSHAGVTDLSSASVTINDYGTDTRSTALILADSTSLKLGIIFGSAVTGTLSTTQATTDLTGYADDQLIDAVIVVTSGAAEGERSDITDYATSTGLITFTAMTTAMANGDTFKIV
ncbi:MAG: hypothetical protein GY938_13605 [Ketobacter sp.]|nr:hypothetical protein [Ketobacter sp.]